MNSLFYILIILGIPSGQTKIQDNDWTHTARLAAGDFWPEMSDYEMHNEIDKLVESGVNVIDVDISWSELNLVVPFLHRVASYTHSYHPEAKIFTYIAPLEYISEGVDQDQNGQIDLGKTSLFTEHPDWLQVGIDGRPAIFYGSLSFWIGPYDEDVWLYPNDPVYKEIWAEMVEELAGTGIDRMYMDVPFFLLWFGENWDEQWSCHCSDCDEKFFIETGSYIPDSIDWDDPIWQYFVSWRYDQITNFITAVDSISKSVNSDIKTIIEHWDGIADAFATACGPIEIREVSDVRTHKGFKG